MDTRKKRDPERKINATIARLHTKTVQRVKMLATLEDQFVSIADLIDRLVEKEFKAKGGALIAGIQALLNDTDAA